MLSDEEKFAAEVRAGLSGVTEEHPAVKAIVRMMERQGEIETASALAAEVSGEVRHYRAGRAAGVLDLLAMVKGEIPKGEK